MQQADERPHRGILAPLSSPRDASLPDKGPHHRYRHVGGAGALVCMQAFVMWKHITLTFIINNHG
jgi:hypothetical protein